MEEEEIQKKIKRRIEKAELGDARVQRNLGCMYHSGTEGAECDYAKAFMWYERAAAQGDYIALRNLGYMYKYGEGVKQDDDKAEEFFEKAKVAEEKIKAEKLKKEREWEIRRKKIEKEIEVEKNIFSQISKADKIYFLENYLGEAWIKGRETECFHLMKKMYGSDIMYDWVFGYPTFWNFDDVFRNCDFNKTNRFFCYAMFDEKVNKVFRAEVEKFVLDLSRDFSEYEKMKEQFLKFKNCCESFAGLANDYYNKGLKFQTVYNKFSKIYDKIIYEKYISDPDYSYYKLRSPSLCRLLFSICLCDGANPDDLLPKAILANYDKHLMSLKDELLKCLSHDSVNYLYLAIKYKVKLESLVIIHAGLKQRK